MLFFSSSNKKRLAASPPPYPVSVPSLPMMRWHGAKIEIALAPFAFATARVAFGSPSCRASSP